jgi:uncharacterized alkaline shock family protein YloU
MKIYGLEGKSGSGKSYQAINLCRERGIESILDDGLFISGGGILAGVSAKRQETKVKAIKTALFSDDAHRDAVAAKIAEVAPLSILIIGTSAKMVGRIAHRLGLPEVEEIISIEAITTPKERAVAERERRDMGKHVIPAPTFQLKKEFSGYFMHPLRIIKDLRGGGNRDADRSVVRPSFSYLGKYTVSNRAVADIVLIVCEKARSVKGVTRVSVDIGEAGVAIWVSATMAYGTRVLESVRALQREMWERLEEMTAFNVNSVNIEVRGLR